VPLKSVVVDETIFGEANLARARLRYDTKTVAVVSFLLCQNAIQLLYRQTRVGMST
jgi:hypothetical protein